MCWAAACDGWQKGGGHGRVLQRIRKAVLGRWLQWEEEGGEHRPANTEFSETGTSSADRSAAFVGDSEVMHADMDRYRGEGGMRNVTSR